MNEEYLRQAVAKVKEMCAERGEKFDLRLFITGISKRAKQLSNGYPRLIPLKPSENPPVLDLALREAAAGKLVIELGNYQVHEQFEHDDIEIGSVND